MAFGDPALSKIARTKAATFALAQHYAKKMEGAARQGASWDDKTGHARQFIHGEAEQAGDTITITLGHGVEYGEMLEEGTPPHVIRPKNKKALFWVGAAHPVKKVNHPGSKAYPIIEPTVEKNFSQLKKDVEELWS